MKKIYILFLALFSVVCLSVTASAAVTEYENVITDETTIEDDFVVLNMDINDYYIPSYDYDKFYVVAMSETYLDDASKIQTYFYLYNPMIDKYKAGIINISLTYNTYMKADLSFLSASWDHGLIKMKGFVYGYVRDYEINISEIQFYYESIVDNPVESDPIITTTSRTDISNFTANNTHSNLYNSFGIELNFNSMLIIDECNVVEVEIHQDDNFVNNWNSFWSNKETTLLVYFYNFNFPKHIEYDSIEYAKFEYDYLTYYQEQYLSESIGTSKIDLIDKSHVISEYNNDSKTLRVNKDSMELTFSTFYLGNRFDDPNFSLKDNVNSGDIDFFDMDVSVLLDSTYKTKTGIPGSLMGVTANVGWKYDYTVLDQIELIELHYKNDGILYKCQVVSPPIDEDDIGKVDSQPLPKQTIWDVFVDWFTSNFPQSLLIIVAVILGIMFLPIIIKIIKPIISILVKIITIPFKIIKSIFKRE